MSVQPLSCHPCASKAMVVGRLRAVQVDGADLLPAHVAVRVPAAQLDRELLRFARGVACRRSGPAGPKVRVVTVVAPAEVAVQRVMYPCRPLPSWLAVQLKVSSAGTVRTIAFGSSRLPFAVSVRSTAAGGTTSSVRFASADAVRSLFSVAVATAGCVTPSGSGPSGSR